MPRRADERWGQRAPYPRTDLGSGVAHTRLVDPPELQNPASEDSVYNAVDSRGKGGHDANSADVTRDWYGVPPVLGHGTLTTRVP